jgi:hypothetical protein
MTDTYYRIVDGYTAESRPVLQRLYVVKRTAKGAWVVHSWAKSYTGPFNTRDALRWVDARHVLDGDGKRYAYPTVAAALDSYMRRKRRQIQHARAAIDRAEHALDWCSRADVADETVTFADPVPLY